MTTNILDFKIYIIRTTEDDNSTNDYQYSTLQNARETASTLATSTFAPCRIDIYGYKQGKEYYIEKY